LAVGTPILTPLVEAVFEVMGVAYPEVARSENRNFVLTVVSREEHRFRETLRSGLTILEAELADETTMLPGDVVFKLHDTFGFPKDLTREIAAERGVGIDEAGFEAAMAEQRQRARSASHSLDP